MTEDQNIELQNAIDQEQAQDAKEQEFRNSIHLTTRVSPEVGAQLMAISNKYGTSIFHILRRLLTRLQNTNKLTYFHREP